MSAAAPSAASPAAPPALAPWPAELERKLHLLRALPARARTAVRGLTQAQLDEPLRKGGWSSRQIVHHVANAHLHAYLRLKMVLIEEQSVIKPWDQDTWEAMGDELCGGIEASLAILDGVHERLATVFETVKPEQWARAAFHPEYKRLVSVRDLLDTYSRHGAHHVEAIEAWRARA
jgi:hypothetical protein